MIHPPADSSRVICYFSIDGNAWSTIDELETSFLDPLTRIDISLVRCSKLLISQYLIENSSDDINGITLKDAILALHPDIRYIIN